MRNDALQIGGFGDGKQHRVVLSLPSNLDQAEAAVGV